MNEKAMHKLSYGLFVLTAKDGDRDNGCIINTAIQAASAPNQLSICVNKANFTHDMIKKTGKFVVSIISQGATFDLFKRFGFQSGKDTDKFADFKGCKEGKNGILYVTEGTNAYYKLTADINIAPEDYSISVDENGETVYGLVEFPLSVYLDYELTRIKLDFASEKKEINYSFAPISKKEKKEFYKNNTDLFTRYGGDKFSLKEVNKNILHKFD